MNPSFCPAVLAARHLSCRAIAIMIICLLWCCLNAAAVAQSKADSLEGVLKGAKGIERATLLYVLSWEYRFSNKDKALQYGEEALQLARQLQDTAAIGSALNSISETWLNFGDYEKAEKITLEELPYARATTPKKNLLGALTRLGTIQYRKGHFDAALVYQLEVQREAEKMNKPEVTGVANLNLGLTYMDLKRYDEALRYFNIGLQAFESIGMSAGIGASYINIAEVLRNQKKYNEALETAQKAEKLLIAAGNKLHLGYIYGIMGKLYGLKNQRPEQLLYLQKSLTLSRENQDDFMIAQNQGDLGRAYMEMGNMQTARQNLYESYSLAEKMQQKTVVIEDYARLRDWHLLQRNFEEARRFDELYNTSMDSIFNAKMAEKVADSETKYETEKKELAIRDLENRNRIKNLQTYGALAGILALLGVLYLMRRAYRQKQRLAEQQEQLQRNTIERLEAEQKVVALRSRLEGQQLERLRIAEDLHDDFGSGLSKISLLSEVAKKKPAASGELDKISGAAKELLLKMSEIVWALNHHNDTLSSLAGYIRRYAVSFFEDSDIACHFDIPDLPEIPLSGELRRNVFLVVKETLHNALKHARADKINIQFSMENGSLDIYIRDNGRGFDTATLPDAGNGLANMQRRMQQSGGQVRIDSRPGEGARTHIHLPFTTFSNTPA